MLTSIYQRKGRKGVTLEYEDPATGRLRQKQFRAKDGRTAKERALDFAGELRGVAHKPQIVATDVSFSEYARRWLRATKTAVRVGTYRNYETAVRFHLEKAFPGRLQDITRGHVRELVIALREGGLQKKTVRNIHGTLHGIMEAALEEGVISSNPAHIRSKSKLMRLSTTAGEHRAKVKAFTAAQVRAFDAAAREVAPRHYLLFRTMVATGLRPGEAIGLRPEDLDYAAKTIRVERQITRGAVQPCKTTETGEFATIDMPADLAEELRAWEAALLEDALSRGQPRPAWLFPGQWGIGHLDDTKRVPGVFKRILKEAELPTHFSPHCLRHTYATQQLVRGTSVYYVQRQLRHADIQMTVSRYGSWLPATDQGAADGLFADLFGGKSQRDVRKGRAARRPGRKN